MNKAFPVVIWLMVLSIGIYLLPEITAFLGIRAESLKRPVILISEDGGKSFQSTYWPTSAEVYDIEVDKKDGRLVYAATDRGLYLSRDNGEHWYDYYDLEKILKGAVIRQIKEIPQSPNRIFLSIFRNGQGEVYETKDKFFTVNKIFDAKSAAVYKLVSDQNNLYLGVSDGRLIKYSLNNGSLSLLTSLGSPITDIIIKNDKIYATTELKETWLGSISGGNFIAFEEKPASPSPYTYTAYLAGASLKTLMPENLIQFVKSDSQGKIYLATSNELYRSFNQGENWQLILNLPDRQVTSLNLESKDKIIVGTGKK